MYLFVDFETCTPLGIPPVPIELGYICVDENEKIEEEGSILFGLPNGVKLTHFDIAQTGIEERMLSGRKVFLENSAMIEKIKSIIGKYGVKYFVAHNASYERNILDTLQIDDIDKTPYLDTMLIGKKLFPKLGKYNLDILASIFNIPIPVNRHRALADCHLAKKLLFKEKEYILEKDEDYEIIKKRCCIRSKNINKQLTLF